MEQMLISREDIEKLKPYAEELAEQSVEAQQRIIIPTVVIGKTGLINNIFRSSDLLKKMGF
jgi:hypothetical protein